MVCDVIELVAETCDETQQPICFIDSISWPILTLVMSHAVKVRYVNHWMVVRFEASRLTDPMTVAEIQKALEEAVAPLPLRAQIAIDFSKVEFVSSQVIGMMLGLRDQIARKHGTLVLCKLGKHVLDVMKVTRLDRHFTFSDSVSKTVGVKEKAQSRRGGNDVEWMD